MARNEWINGPLEAILDAGAGRGGVHGNNSSRSGNEKKRFEEKLRLEQFDHDIDKEKRDNKLISTTKYFVEEVVNGFDESDLYRTWITLEACVHPFFDDLREPTTSLPNGRPLPPLFNFTPQELVGASPELRQRLILEHVRK